MPYRPVVTVKVSLNIMIKKIFFKRKKKIQKCSGLLFSPSTHFCKSAVMNWMGYPNSGDKLLKTIAF